MSIALCKYGDIQELKDLKNKKILQTFPVFCWSNVQTVNI